MSDQLKRPKPLLLLIIGGVALALWVNVYYRQRAAGEIRGRIDAGIEAVRLGRPADAEREWLAAAKLNPGNPAIWELLSELYINTEQWKKGADSLTTLHRIDPNRKLIYSRLAACTLRMANEIEAQKLANEELKVNPTDESSLTILAFLSGMQENTELQVGYLKRILDKNPKNAEALHDLAQADIESGKFSEALATADKLVAVSPNDGFGYAIRGAARFEIDASQAAFTQCEADLLKALQSSPLSGFGRFNLGRVYHRHGDCTKAVYQLELAQKLYPSKMDVPFELANAYAKLGQKEKSAASRSRFELLRSEATSLSVLQKKCSLDPNDFDSFLKMGEHSLLIGNTRKAYYYVQHAMALKPNDPKVKEANKKLLLQMRGDTAAAG